MSVLWYVGDNLEEGRSARKEDDHTLYIDKLEKEEI